MTSGRANEVGFAWRMNCSKIEENRETPLAAKGFKTGGRTAGTLNKRTEAMLEEIASTGETPLQYMLRVMRDPEAPPARRDAMAVAAAPYIHCKLAQTDLTAQQQPKITGVRFWTREEWLAFRIAEENNSRLITNDVSDAVAIDEH
jgi:hypothetical protein